MIIATFKIKKQNLALMEGHKLLSGLLHVLRPSMAGVSWYRVPHSAEENGKAWVRVSEEDTFLRQTALDMGMDAAPWAEVVEGYAALITSASNQDEWNAAGRTVIDFAPWRGVVRIETFGPPGDPLKVLEDARNRFSAACSYLDVEFACCDFSRSPLPNGLAGETYFGIDHRVFPHREFIGWMGFVKKAIQRWEVPEADELILLPEKGGTMIVAVADAFDVHNRDHVEKAQRVEMRLVDLDALPVTDPRFL